MSRSFSYPLLAGSVGLLLLLLSAASPVSEPPAQSPVPTTATPVMITPPIPTTATPVTVGTVTRTPSPTPTPTPPPTFSARIRRVDFTNNLEIQRDRLSPSPTQDLPPQRITEFDGDAIEWKDDNCDGVTNKNWPAGYPRFSAVALDIELCVRLQGVSSVIATVRGTTQLAGTELVFEKAGVTLVDGVNIVKGFVSQPMRSPEVRNDEPMTIRWRVSSDLGTVDAGPSGHNIYITLQDPLAPFPIYFTVIDWTTHAARRATSAIELVDRLESDLKDRSLYRRDFNPVSGAIDHRQALLHYWTDVSPGKPLAVLFSQVHNPFTCGRFFTVELLLMKTDGRCGAWALFMLNALGIHGVAAEGIHVAVASSGCTAAAQQCIMLVNRWSFHGRGTSGDSVYPYTSDEVFDAPGVAGQGNRNPPPFFWDHAIVRVGIGNQGPHYFDPSYGTGPFDTLERYEFASIDGYCKPVGAGAAGLYQCQKDPPGQQLGVIDVFN
jgi:hypothetical protein